MAWELSEKQQIIAMLTAQLQQSQDLEAELVSAHKYTEADKLREANTELAEKIDTLNGHALDQWGSDAQTVTAGLQTAKAAFDKATAEIERDIEIAANIIKVIGYMTEIMKIVLPIL
jgi:hypothetical protein